jgi:hypothetical protein
MTTARPGDRPRVKTPPPVVLWRPRIVLATSTGGIPARPPAVLPEPTADPDLLRRQLGAARALVASLADARQALAAVAAEANTRAGQASSTRERVSATIAAYRAEATLDDVLTGTWRQVAALMEERGLR